MVAYVAHYYGLDPRAVESWKTSEIVEWHKEAIKLENEKYKAAQKAQDGEKR